MATQKDTRLPSAIEPLLEIGDLAALLRMTVSAVKMARSRGQMPPALQIGKRVRWRPVDVKAWLDKRAAEAVRGAA